MALIDNNTWKLRKLPQYDEIVDNVSTYFVCAYHVRDSLKELNLTTRMIGRKDFDCFGEFKQLTILTVHKNVLKGVYDCSNLLRHLPQLKIFKVQGFQMEYEGDTTAMARVNDISNNIIVRHSSIKELSLDSYEPSRDDELLYLMNCYTELDDLTLYTMEATSLPAATISRSVLMSFMKFFSKCSYYCIAFGGVSGETWLMDLFYNCQMDMKKNDLTTDFFLIYSPNISGAFELDFVNEDYFCFDASVRLTYGTSNDDHDEGGFNKIKARLTNLHASTESFRIDLGDD